jgi:hypothetical protein
MKLWLSPLVAAVLASSAASAQEVTLPLERYEDLRARSRPAAEEAVPPAAPFALEAAQLEITVGRTSARVSQRLTVSIYSAEWVSIPLAPTGSLTSAQLGTLDGRIESGSGMTLVARGRGRHQLRIDSVVPLRDDDSAARTTRTAKIALPTAAAVTGALVTGEETEEVAFVSGGLPRASSLAHRFEFVGEPGATLDVRLLGKGRPPERARLPLKYDAVSSALTELARTRTRISARLVFEVSSGQADGFEVELPKGFDVVSVLPRDLGWTAEGTRLTLTPAAPVEKMLAVEVALTGEPQQTFAAPLLVPKGASRLTLLTAVQVSADGIPVLTEPGSSRRAEAPELAKLPEAMRSVAAPFFVVRDPSRPPRWTITWSEESEVLAAQVDRLVVNALVGSAGRAAYQLWAAVRSTGSTALVLEPPEGLELVAVERDGVAVVPGTSGKGLAVPLGSGGGTQVVHISGLLSLRIPPEGELALPLPGSSAPIGEVEVAVRLPGNRSYALVNAERAGTVSGLPEPKPGSATVTETGAKPADSPAWTLAALAGAGGVTPRRQAVWFQGSANSVLVQARWSALASTLGPLAIRVKPSREKKEGWF